MTYKPYEAEQREALAERLRLLASADSKRGRFADAAETLELAMMLDPMSPETWRLWAEAELLGGNVLKADALREVARCL